MICHERRTIFIHVPKAAGTSIEAALGHYPDGVLRDGQDHRTLRQLQWPNGGGLQVVRRGNFRESAHAVMHRVQPPEYPPNRRTLSKQQFREYFKFTVVRNPWARTYSWYANVIADPLHQQRLGAPADIEFPAFARRYLGVDALRPQLHWLIDFRGRVGVDMVCRFETLERDFERACDLGRFGALTLPYLNRSPDCDAYTNAYDDRTRYLVSERFRHEISAFGYQFEGRHSVD